MLAKMPGGSGDFQLDVLHRMTFSASWSRFFKEWVLGAVSSLKKDQPEADKYP